MIFVSESLLPSRRLPIPCFNLAHSCSFSDRDHCARVTWVCRYCGSGALFDEAMDTRLGGDRGGGASAGMRRRRRFRSTGSLVSADVEPSTTVERSEPHAVPGQSRIPPRALQRVVLLTWRRADVHADDSNGDGGGGSSCCDSDASDISSRLVDSVSADSTERALCPFRLQAPTPGSPVAPVLDPREGQLITPVPQHGSGCRAPSGRPSSTPLRLQLEDPVAAVSSDDGLRGSQSNSSVSAPPFTVSSESPVDTAASPRQARPGTADATPGVRRDWQAESGLQRAKDGRLDPRPQRS
jgi:hypothetical protein